MSEHTPETDRELDGTDIMNDDTEFVFPGAEREDLTEEERSFTFDEDYLDGDFPPAAA